MASSAFIDEVLGEQISAYANLAGFALLVYDYCLTVHHEIHWLWGEKWTWGRVVFTIARYSPFPGLALTVIAALEAVTFKSCKQSQATNYIHIASIVAAEGLLMMRIWAFWGCSRRLLVILLTTAAIFLGLAIGLTSYVSDLLPGRQLPVGTLSDACNFSTGRSSTIQYGFLVVYELILLSLTIWRWFAYHRSTHSQLVNTVYRGSIFYIMCMTGFSLFNILNAAVSPAYHNEYLDSLQITMHSVLSARIFFRMRETTEETRDSPLPSHMSSFRVADPAAATADTYRSSMDDTIVGH
ncbi:hypothetical protein CONPUDRAFT_84227 [Coniophora puteana RWD-64-598 SS2]|uniref:DUF6533 domain-containing protein n=1 Tax=Coniophora puteana (strain RWD-64-598) TaxID=741705 RepID=A0A5M3MGS5_CONPW|nr:uncharacterized protein CONPUDRAFT_84227 [Coniophora puteana RWD-64-598 SS2]EIW77974.1 hypothetical protein CONPUDRAFT_84227 [Coniophora puteana RWD-64-598 SS2]